ncbi:hypothetical protein CR970_02425 [Candidatus Saccharibacteria bacterium]|nr:MAG: hypothetical protein CR970_02425 [Candidatus Saccharibacteria bacterium]
MTEEGLADSERLLAMERRASAVCNFPTQQSWRKDQTVAPYRELMWAAIEHASPGSQEDPVDSADIRVTPPSASPETAGALDAVITATRAASSGEAASDGPPGTAELSEAIARGSIRDDLGPDDPEKVKPRRTIGSLKLVRQLIEEEVSGNTLNPVQKVGAGVFAATSLLSINAASRIGSFRDRMLGATKPEIRSGYIRATFAVGAVAVAGFNLYRSLKFGSTPNTENSGAAAELTAQATPTDSPSPTPTPTQTTNIGETPNPPSETGAETPAVAAQNITVKRGDTLRELAIDHWRSSGKMPTNEQLQQYIMDTAAQNNIKNMDLIHPGDSITFGPTESVPEAATPPHSGPKTKQPIPHTITEQAAANTKQALADLPTPTAMTHALHNHHISPGEGVLELLKETGVDNPDVRRAMTSVMSGDAAINDSLTKSANPLMYEYGANSPHLANELRIMYPGNMIPAHEQDMTTVYGKLLGMRQQEQVLYQETMRNMILHGILDAGLDPNNYDLAS